MPSGLEKRPLHDTPKSKSRGVLGLTLARDTTRDQIHTVANWLTLYPKHATTEKTTERQEAGAKQKQRTGLRNLREVVRDAEQGH